MTTKASLGFIVSDSRGPLVLCPNYKNTKGGIALATGRSVSLFASRKKANQAIAHTKLYAKEANLAWLPAWSGPFEVRELTNKGEN